MRSGEISLLGLRGVRALLRWLKILWENKQSSGRFGSAAAPGGIHRFGRSGVGRA